MTDTLPALFTPQTLQNKKLRRVALLQIPSRLSTSTLQSAATMTTTLKEQAWQSGLVLYDETAAWNVNDWPPLVGGARGDHATVVLDHPDTDKDNNNKEHTVVVMGGYQRGRGELDSVLVLNLSDPDKQWQEGPPMNKSRRGHAAVVCNGGIYVIGGYNGNSRLDCIIQKDLFITNAVTLSLSSSTKRYFLGLVMKSMCD